MFSTSMPSQSFLKCWILVHHLSKESMPRLTMNEPSAFQQRDRNFWSGDIKRDLGSWPILSQYQQGYAVVNRLHHYVLHVRLLGIHQWHICANSFWHRSFEVWFPMTFFEVDANYRQPMSLLYLSNKFSAFDGKHAEIVMANNIQFELQTQKL